MDNPRDSIVSSLPSTLSLPSALLAPSPLPQAPNLSHNLPHSQKDGSRSQTDLSDAQNSLVSHNQPDKNSNQLAQPIQVFQEQMHSNEPPQNEVVSNEPPIPSRSDSRNWHKPAAAHASSAAAFSAAATLAPTSTLPRLGSLAAIRAAAIAAGIDPDNPEEFHAVSNNQPLNASENAPAHPSASGNMSENTNNSATEMHAPAAQKTAPLAVAISLQPSQSSSIADMAVTHSPEPVSPTAGGAASSLKETLTLLRQQRLALQDATTAEQLVSDAAPAAEEAALPQQPPTVTPSSTQNSTAEPTLSKWQLPPRSESVRQLTKLSDSAQPRQQQLAQRSQTMPRSFRPPTQPQDVALEAKINDPTAYLPSQTNAETHSTPQSATTTSNNTGIGNFFSNIMRTLNRRRHSDRDDQTATTNQKSHEVSSRATRGNRSNTSETEILDDQTVSMRSMSRPLPRERASTQFPSDPAATTTLVNQADSDSNRIEMYPARSHSLSRSRSRRQRKNDAEAVTPTEQMPKTKPRVMRPPTVVVSTTMNASGNASSNATPANSNATTPVATSLSARNQPLAHDQEALPSNRSPIRTQRAILPISLVQQRSQSLSRNASIKSAIIAATSSTASSRLHTETQESRSGLSTPTSTTAVLSSVATTATLSRTRSPGIKINARSDSMSVMAYMSSMNNTIGNANSAVATQSNNAQDDFMMDQQHDKDQSKRISMLQSKRIKQKEKAAAKLGVTFQIELPHELPHELPPIEPMTPLIKAMNPIELFYLTRPPSVISSSGSQQESWFDRAYMQNDDAAPTTNASNARQAFISVLRDATLRHNAQRQHENTLTDTNEIDGAALENATNAAGATISRQASHDRSQHRSNAVPHEHSAMASVILPLSAVHATPSAPPATGQTGRRVSRGLSVLFMRRTNGPSKLSQSSTLNRSVRNLLDADVAANKSKRHSSMLIDSPRLFRSHTISNGTDKQEVTRHFIYVRAIADTGRLSTNPTDSGIVVVTLKVSRKVDLGSILDKLGSHFAKPERIQPCWKQFPGHLNKPVVVIQGLRYRDLDGHLISIEDEEDWLACVDEAAENDDGDMVLNLFVEIEGEDD